MKKPSDNKSNKSNYRNKIIGLSESSTRKSYYPQLMNRLQDLEKREQQLEEQSEILKQTVSELQEAQTRILESESRYKSLVENTTDIIMHITSDYTIMFINHPFPGSRKEALLGTSFLDYISTEFHETVRNILSSVLSSGKPADFDYTFQYENSTIWYSSRVAPIIENNQTISLIIIVSDITQRVNAQEKIKQSLKEKETLLKEVHHRVKNNLQVISSFLGLQEHYMRDPYDAGLLKDGQSRITAMALIHKKLYQSQDFSMINIQSFLEEYLNYISAFYNISTSDIAFNVTIDGIFLDIERAVPCGQIINELVTNSIKHAFPEKKGTIEVTMKQTSDGKYLLSVSDDGTGIPDHVDLRGSKTLGMELIFLLSDQLNGEVILEREPGTKTTIVF